MNLLAIILQSIYSTFCFNFASSSLFFPDIGNATAILVLTLELPLVASFVTTKHTHIHTTFVVALILVHIIPLFLLCSLMLGYVTVATLNVPLMKYIYVPILLPCHAYNI